MRFNDQLSFIFQHLKRSKLRISMTILATTIGCAFLIILASVGFGLQKTFEDELLSSDTVTQISLYGDESFSQDDVKTIEAVDNVNVVLEKTIINGYADITFEDRQGSTSPYILDMNSYAKLSDTVQEGRLPENENEIVVGANLGQVLLNDIDKLAIEQKSREAEQNGTWYNGEDEGYKGSLIGKTIELQMFNYEGEAIGEARTYKIVGMKKPSSYEWFVDSDIIFHQNMKAKIEEMYLIPQHTIYVDTAENVLPVVETLKEKGYQVYSQLEQLDQMETIFFVFKAGLVFVGTIAVLIASIGIFNTMTMAVTERTREIGILKAIGATPGLIQRLFLMESLFIGVIGTILALIISYAVSFAGNLITPIIMQEVVNEGQPIDFTFTFSLIPPSLIIVASAISLTIAILSGWRPARKATKIEVIKALQQV